MRGELAAETSELELIVRLQSVPVPDEPAIASAIERLRLASTYSARSRSSRAPTPSVRESERNCWNRDPSFTGSITVNTRPVCGASDALSKAWATATTKEIGKTEEGSGGVRGIGSHKQQGCNSRGAAIHQRSARDTRASQRHRSLQGPRCTEALGGLGERLRHRFSEEARRPPREPCAGARGSHPRAHSPRGGREDAA